LALRLTYVLGNERLADFFGVIAGHTDYSWNGLVHPERQRPEPFTADLHTGEHLLVA